MLTSIVVLIILCFVIFWFSFKNRKLYTYFLCLFPLLLVFSEQADVFPFIAFEISWYVMLLFMVSIVIFPFTFLIKKIDQRRNLLLFLSLLILWDWIISWIYIHHYYVYEVNVLLNINSFWIFSFQKLIFIGLFTILYLIAEEHLKLMRVLEVGLGVVALGYYVLFLWHIYVVSIFNEVMIYVLIPTFLFAFVMVYLFFFKSKVINKGLANVFV